MGEVISSLIADNSFCMKGPGDKAETLYSEIIYFIDSEDK